ncbi:MAG: GNAT family N-acetyltransferase [Myxococcota bacterium]
MSPPGKLVEASACDPAVFDAFLGSFGAGGDGVHGLAALDVMEQTLSAEEAIALLEDHRRGERLPEGWVPSTTWFWASEEGLQGVINLRHCLTPFLEDFGGHVGYAVAPEFRRRGIATAMLAGVVRAAQELGIPRLLVTCDAQNRASARTIELNSGRLEREGYSEVTKGVMRWYWIACDDSA